MWRGGGSGAVFAPLCSSALLPGRNRSTDRGVRQRVHDDTERASRLSTQ
jgi:hypothetical protein